MSIQPDPRDTRDLARDAAIHGGVDEETLLEAYQKVQRRKQQADDEQARDLWDEAEQALLGAIGRARREGENT